MIALPYFDITYSHLTCTYQTYTLKCMTQALCRYVNRTHRTYTRKSTLPLGVMLTAYTFISKRDLHK